ncbi:phosphoribosyl-AMP cyclohydrolase [Methylacidimicrobium sp. AP8]|uniref:phosphoribosyl-AMP cyclohydrolase n=1 Tax=Methylacidimicrobium sp. AP8 TaxID=2730359 RepID=UPI00192490CE|nr:phosphoribosyl-AMP cyclohydrolase [Methylacidimicrobium sp. AP8]
MSAGSEIEQSSRLEPRFDPAGTIPCITVDAETGEVLMVAYMNREALDRTIATGLATYYSRSRGKLWVKGEESGFVQQVREIRVDCDQDCLLLKVSVKGGASCHVGYRSCFYRRLKPGSAEELEFTESQKVFDPEKVYRRSS